MIKQRHARGKSKTVWFCRDLYDCLHRKKMANPPQNTRCWRNWFMYFQYKEDRDPPTEVRNVLLVVATLIAAVNFQAAGVNPPSGVRQGNDRGHSRAGRAIYASEKEAFYVFLIPNTLALSALVLVIMSLTCTEVPF